MMVRNTSSGSLEQLTGAYESAPDVLDCAVRYLLSDDLIGLCTALAYSKGARTLECVDLLHVPHEQLWLEWSDTAWLQSLECYGFKADMDTTSGHARRGVLLKASADGRRGWFKTFWSAGQSGTDVLASSMEAHFDLDGLRDTDLPGPTGRERIFRVTDSQAIGGSLLARCFAFKFEESWARYYARANLSAADRAVIERHCLGTIALDVPLVLTFFLLLGTRNGLPMREVPLDRLNRARLRRGKSPLLEHIEVLAPLLAPVARESANWGSSSSTRRSPRCHPVRGHLVRRGQQIFWRVPHLRGDPRMGAVKTRTMKWTFENPRPLA
jgi:hypothetical protein